MEKQPVQKPLGISMNDLKSDLMRTIENSKIHVSIVSMILKEIAEEVSYYNSQQLQREQMTYKQALEEAATKDQPGPETKKDLAAAAATPEDPKEK